MTRDEWRLFPRAFRRRFSRHFKAGQPMFCHWCQRPLTRNTASVEHVEARGLGGPNRLENMVPACKTCNQIRGVDVAWFVHCTHALERYWFAMERGATQEVAADYARREQPLGRYWGRTCGHAVA